MTETLLHSMVSLSGRLSTEMVELLDLLGSNWNTTVISQCLQVGGERRYNCNTPSL